jgi:hypothetical protein
MEYRLRAKDWLVIVALLSALPGCGRGGGGESSGGGAIQYRKVRAMTNLYGEYYSQHRGQAPASEQAFRQYLATKQDVLEDSELTVDQMFASPRGTGPLVWVYGQAPPTGELGIYFAYEQTPVDGKRLLIGNLGVYEEVDDAKFRAIFPNAE